MGKPILFDTISRKKFDALDDAIKAKRNYQIKEDDGKVSRHIAGLEGSAGGNLPEVSVNDSGKVLTVNESGKWAAASTQGNNNFVVTYTMNEETSVVTADKTFTEILAAIEAGKSIRAEADGQVLIIGDYTASETGGVTFYRLSYNSGKLSYIQIDHEYNDSIEPLQKVITLDSE